MQIINTVENKLDQIRNMSRNFDVINCDIGELEPEWIETKGHDGVVRRAISKINHMGQSYQVGSRFLVSLCAKFGIGQSVFNLFAPTEVFERLQMVNPRVRVRGVHDGCNLLAISAPSKALLKIKDVIDLLENHSDSLVNVDYGHGIVSALVSMEEDITIGSRKFTQAFQITMPVDGYGTPIITLALRNGQKYMVFSDRSFKSQIQIGDARTDAIWPVKRIINTFNNDEGFNAIYQRLTSADHTIASIRESGAFERLVHQSMGASGANHQTYVNVCKSITDLTGSIEYIYGLASYDSISDRRARLLPANCTVGDIIYFMMELTSRFLVDPTKIYEFIGGLVTNEFDLEGTENTTVVTKTTPYITH